MATNVLVVDDQVLPRQLFQKIIESSEDFSLTACIDSARMADLYCAKGNVDLIMMDVVMQDDISGIEMTKKIKKSFPDIKIIIVTSMPDGIILEKAKAAGADSFWYKEIQDQSMLDIMRRTMKGERIFPDQAPDVKLGNIDSSKITEREMEVLRLLVSGYSDQEIAGKLGMSYHTERFHMNSLLNKCGCDSRTKLAVLAAKVGIIVPEI